MKFGLSPFGIYRPQHPRSISGFDQYDVLFADARLWLNEGWVDYWSPQLYWPINRIPQSFPVLLGWWVRENKKDRHLWPGLFTSKVKDEAGVDENLNQIMIIRGFEPTAPGHIHFSAKALMDTSATLSTALLTGPYRRQALVPPSPWLDSEAPQPPQVSYALQNDTLMIRWSHQHKEDVFRWVVYYQQGKAWNYQILNKEDAHLEIPLYTVTEETDEKVAITQIAVSAVDRSGNESAHRTVRILSVK